MGLAKTDRSGAVGLSGTATLSQVNAWAAIQTGNVSYGPAAALIIIGGGQAAAASWYMYQTTLDGAPNYWARAYCLATANHGGIGGGTTAEDTFGTYINMPPLWTWTKTSDAYDGSVYRDALHLYCMVDRTSEMLDLEGGPSSACHPNHGSLKYCWGNVDGYGLGANADLVSEADSGHTLTPEWGAGGTGTCDLGAFTIGVSISKKPSLAVSGVVSAISDINYYLGSEETGGPTLDGIRIPAEGSTTGCHAEGSGAGLSFVIDDWTQIPTGGLGFSITVYAPICIDWWLRSYSWAAPSSADFSIVADSGTGTKVVTATYRERKAYWYVTWTGGSSGARPFKATVNLDSAWAVAQDENVVPADLKCTIEGHDLTLPTYSGEAPALDSLTNILLLQRDFSTKVQLPSGSTSLPSPWVAQGTGITVDQSGQTTTVNVAATASEGSIKRTLLDYWFLVATTGTGIALYGFSWCYQHLAHEDGYDVANWENYGFLKVTYNSDQAVSDGWLEVTNKLVTVTDNHLTGSERVDGFSIASETETVRLDFPIVAGTGQVAYIDLGSPTGRKLQHIATVEIGGFDGVPGGWHFDLTDLELIAYNPTDLVESGRPETKIVFARLNPTTDLPNCYTGITCTVEGNRCCRPPDQVVTVCDEAGVDFCEKLTGAVTGEVLDHGNSMGDIAWVWNHQEGWSVQNATATPAPWDTTHAIYVAAFKDADGNDMLGGLYAWDQEEEFDKLFHEDGDAYVGLQVRPRVGAVYPASGAVIPVAVKKHLRGNVEGQVGTLDDEGNLVRYTGGDLTVYLYEKDDEGATTQVTSETIDDWGRFCWHNDSGIRENRSGGGTLTADGSSVATWFAPKNEFRRWVTGLTKSTGGDIDNALDYAGRGWVAYVRGTTKGPLYAKYKPYPAAAWSTQVQIGTGTSYWHPSVCPMPDASILVSATDMDAGHTDLFISKDDGRTWTELT